MSALPARRPYEPPRLVHVRLEVEQATMQICKSGGGPNRTGGRCRSSPSCMNKKQGS